MKILITIALLALSIRCFGQGLIPNMSSDTVPAGIASASSSNSLAYLAFTNGTWQSETETVPTLQYQFQNMVTVTGLVMSISGSTSSNIMQYSLDGSSWTTLFASNSWPNGSVVSIPATTANYFRWYFPNAGSGYEAVSGANLFGQSYAAIPLFAGALTHFWPTNGGSVSFSAFGWNNSISGSNIVSVILEGSTLFQSAPTAGRYHAFTLRGNFVFDGTNLSSGIQFDSGDTNQPSSSAFLTLSNFNISAPIFGLYMDAAGDTNLVLTGGQISSDGYVPGYGQAQTNLVTNYCHQSPLTIVNSTDSTLGLGAGLLVWDTNYIYVSVGTNHWKRVSLGSW